MKRGLDVSILDDLHKSDKRPDNTGQNAEIGKTNENGDNFMFMGKWEKLSPGDPWYEEIIEYEEVIETEYDKRIKKCFADAMLFLDTHKHPRTYGDWEQIAQSLAAYSDLLTVGLICECIKELEREYNITRSNP